MSFKPLSSSARESLAFRAKRYHEALFSPEGSSLLDYLTSRGLTEETIRRFQLGAVVGLPEGSEDQQYHGRLAIPYLSPTGVTALRFRAGPGQDGPKYLQPPGTHAGIYNTEVVLEPRSWICVTEGEVDCMSITQAGLPCVGYPGVSTWESFHRHIFDGYESVVILADGDDTGLKFANRVAEKVNMPRVLQMPPGSDVNDMLQKEGEAWLRKLVTGGS